MERSSAEVEDKEDKDDKEDKEGSERSSAEVEEGRRASRRRMAPGAKERRKDS